MGIAKNCKVNIDTSEIPPLYSVFRTAGGIERWFFGLPIFMTTFFGDFNCTR